MPFAGINVERKPFAQSRLASSAAVAATAAALALTGHASAQVISPEPPVAPPPSLNANTASLGFNFSSIPDEVPHFANGAVSNNGLVAKFTGGLGPITSSTFAVAASQGAIFSFGGDILGGVQPGEGLCMEFEIAVSFTGGFFKWGAEATAFVSNAGGYTQSFSGQLPESGVITGSRDYFFVVGSSRNGQYTFDFAFNWLNARPDDTLTIDVRTVRYEICTIPSPGAAGVFASAAMAFAMQRRRR